MSYKQGAHSFSCFFSENVFMPVVRVMGINLRQHRSIPAYIGFHPISCVIQLWLLDHSGSSQVAQLFEGKLINNKQLPNTYELRAHPFLFCGTPSWCACVVFNATVCQFSSFERLEITSQ